MSSNEGMPMQDKNGLTCPSDIRAAFNEQLWCMILSSETLSSYSLIVFLPLTGNPGIDPSMENDGIRSVETAYRIDLQGRRPQPCRVVAVSSASGVRLSQLEEALGIS